MLRSCNNQRFLLGFIIVTLLVSAKSFSVDFDLQPLHLFKCWRALRKLNTRETPTKPESFKIDTAQKSKVIDLISQLRPQSFNESPESQWGGLVYRNIEGNLSVLFWPLNSKNDFKKVIQEALDGELRAVDHYLRNPKNEKLQLMHELRANLTHLTSQLRKSEQIPEALSERFYGFLVHKDKPSPSSPPKIKSIDFDLNLTGETKNRVLFGWIDEVQSMIRSIGKSISPQLKPEVYRLNSNFFDSYLGPNALQAPSGSRLEKLAE